MATANGARAVGAEGGTLEMGHKADVVNVDLKKDRIFISLLTMPLEARRKQVESHLLLGCNGTGLETVIVDGRVAVRDQEVLDIDEDANRKEMNSVFAV